MTRHDEPQFRLLFVVLVAIMAGLTAGLMTVLIPPLGQIAVAVAFGTGIVAALLWKR